MPRVTFIPDGRSAEVPAGTTIVQAAAAAGLLIESPCNQVGVCGKCQVQLAPESIFSVIRKGKHQLSKKKTAAGFVLACQTEIYQDAVIELSGQETEDSLKILSHGESAAIDIDSFITKKYDPSADVTTIYGDAKILGVERGNTEKSCFGLVVDIGTTTLVAVLIDLRNGRELAVASRLNPQALRAQDVLSRIQFAADASGLVTLYSELITEINRMIGELLEQTGIGNNHIYETVFSGNTCMLHLAVNVNPQLLGKYPYTPVISGHSHHEAVRHNLNTAKFGLIYLPPVISSYVGADITSGIVAVRLHEKEELTLLVDIGTNGEMVLGCRDGLTATSTAAGPAFEGMNITHGMRAARGAIEYFEIEPDGGVSVKTIGGGVAIGICGSGLLDIVAELLVHGLIDKNGKLVNPELFVLLDSLKNRLRKIDGKSVFQITENVYITQKDIRQVQLAKGAIRAGIEFLLAHAGVAASHVEKVLIAGSFGYHLQFKSLINLGLLPREFEGKVVAVGNTSKSGGQAFLLNKAYRREMADLVGRVSVIELANCADFDKVFVNCLTFQDRVV